MWNIEGSEIDKDELQRYVEEQIYSLPGTESHRDEFTVLLTGSRAMGTHTPESDVDIDVLCPQSVYQAVHRASLDAGIIKSPTSSFCTLGDDSWRRYFGEKMWRPHFSLNPLENVERQITECDDVALWIWTHAKVIADPGQQFQRILDGFHGYPKEVLVRKIKYRWLLSAYWAFDVCPYRPSKSYYDDEILAAATGVLNAMNELLRVFFLVEGKPFPYTENLMRFAEQTKLGKEFCPVMRQKVDLVVGKTEPHLSPWERFDQVLDFFQMDIFNERLTDACQQAMIAAGVDAKWVEADYNNIYELLSGSLGPVP